MPPPRCPACCARAWTARPSTRRWRRSGRSIRAANGYIDRQAPWALRRTDTVRMGAVLRVLADTLRVIATVLQPFMPGSMARMLDQLGVPADARIAGRPGGAAGGRHGAAARRRACSRATSSRRHEALVSCI